MHSPAFTPTTRVPCGASAPAAVRPAAAIAAAAAAPPASRPAPRRRARVARLPAVVRGVSSSAHEAELVGASFLPRHSVGATMSMSMSILSPAPAAPRASASAAEVDVDQPPVALKAVTAAPLKAVTAAPPARPAGPGNAGAAAGAGWPVAPERLADAPQERGRRVRKRPVKADVVKAPVADEPPATQDAFSESPTAVTYSRFARPVPAALPHEIMPRKRGRDSLKRAREAEYFRRYLFLRRQLKPWSQQFQQAHGRTPNLADVHKSGVPGLLDRFVEYLDVLNGLRNG